MQTIYLDISNKGVVPTVYAKQNDVGRKFAVILTDSGLPYIPEIGSVFSVWYKGASGDGNYTDIGNKSAFSLNGNKVEVEMIVQMLSAHGDGILCLTLNSPDGNQISSWNIPYMCEMVPGSESEKAEEYYTAFSELVEKLKQVTENLTPEAIGAAPMEYTKKVGNPHNLLDNSDFRNPVNQRGQLSYTDSVYGIDRWYVESGTLSIGDDCVNFTTGAYYQLCDNETAERLLGKTLTVAVMDNNGNIRVGSGIVSSNAYSPVKYGEDFTFGLHFFDTSMQMLRLIVNSGYTASIKWVALYEGEYTAETLPEYQPKGYTAELLECRRYYRKIDAGNYFFGVATSSNKTASFMLQHEQKMRTTPTVTASDNFSIVVYTQTGYSTIAPNTSPYGVPAEVVCPTNTDNGMNIQATFDVSGVASENNTPIIVRIRTGYLDISADL